MEEGSDSPDEPKAFFILHNIPPINQFDFWSIPPINEDPVEHVASTYGHAVDTILTGLLDLVGRIGGLYINLRSEGYLEIPPTEGSWDADSFPRLLAEVLEDCRVPQGRDDAIVWHTTNLRSLFNRFPQNRRVIGCLVGDHGRNIPEIGIRDFLETRVHSNENLVFVVGNFRNYRELEEQIDNYVQVLNPESSPHQCIDIICEECQRKWNLT